MIMLFLVFGEYTRRVKVFGTVVPSSGVSRIFTPVTGRILAQHVTEGQTVTQGSVLYVIALDSQTAAGETGLLVKEQLIAQKNELEKTITERQSLNVVEKANLINQATSSRQELAKVEEQISGTTEYLSSLQKSMDTYRKLADQHLTVSAEFEYREQNFMGARQQLQSLQRDKIQLNERLKEAESKLSGFDDNAAITLGDYRQRMASLDQAVIEDDARRSIDIVAPRSGTVTGMIAKVGQMIPTGGAMATIIPNDDTMEIQLLAESSSMGFVREGQKVMLRYTAYPYQKFGQYPGTISSISRVSLAQEEIPFASARLPTDTDQQKYRIIVEPDANFVHAYGEQISIKPGMSAEANIQLDTRRLYQWIVEPLYSLKGSVL
ncbi:HlyD family secretion protein [Rhizobium sp. 11_C7_N12_5]|uniref:HlyD family secretion protein n=1 Tax=Rhizobium sp. 11_C7_N12_5 TaxID=3240770 RepID=UPI003F221F87